MFQIDYKKLIVWLVPSMLRQSIVMLLLRAAIMPIRELYDAFQLFMSDTLYRLNHNSQVCYLRAVLNDKFDLIERRILIDDFEGLNRIYFWPESDRRDIDFSVTQYFWPDASYADSGVDFTVIIPTGVAVTAAEMARLNSTIKEYKLPGKNYNIVRI